MDSTGQVKILQEADVEDLPVMVISDLGFSIVGLEAIDGEIHTTLELLLNNQVRVIFPPNPLKLIAFAAGLCSEICTKANDPAIESHTEGLNEVLRAQLTDILQGQGSMLQ